MLHLLIADARLAILQLYDVTVLHVLVDVTERGEENVGISSLGVKLGDRAIELILTSHRQSEAMHECLTFLLVSLRGMTLKGFGDELEVGLVVAIIG